MIWGWTVPLTAQRPSLFVWRLHRKRCNSTTWNTVFLSGRAAHNVPRDHLRTQPVLGQNRCSYQTVSKNRILKRLIVALTRWMEYVAQGHGVIVVIVIHIITLQACAITGVWKRALMEPEGQIFLSRKWMIVFVPFISQQFLERQLLWWIFICRKMKTNQRFEHHRFFLLCYCWSIMLIYCYFKQRAIYWAALS